MPKLAANLSTLFPEVPFLDRFERAARAGFSAVEFQFAYVVDVHEIRARIDDNGLALALFNMPAGDWDRGERGLACHAGRRDEFRTGVDQAIARAVMLGCPRVHMLAGVAPEGSDLFAMRKTYVDNLRHAARRAAEAGVDVMIEPISRETVPGYFLGDIELAADLIAEAGEPNVFIQYDLFHRRFAGADLMQPYLAHAEHIGHVQIAGWPGRQEPDIGELDWRGALEGLDAAGYSGFVGCEYWPAKGTDEGLGWARRWLETAR